MAKELFGTDGIRGVAGSPPLDQATVYAFGVALGREAAAGRPALPGGSSATRWPARVHMESPRDLSPAARYASGRGENDHICANIRLNQRHQAYVRTGAKDAQ